ncbi:MAG: hypothetical protein IJZ39_10485 [Oscillospiraceae bacterium]|nr:hypothetical protein [Oscillospiraceae bacterium]
MLELIITVVFIWLFFKVLGLFFRAAWGLTKFIASALLTIAAATLIGGLMFAGGLLLLIPVALVIIALGLLKCII